MSSKVSLIVPHTNETPAVLRVEVDGKVDLYLSAELACDVPNHRLWDLVGYRAKDRGHEKAIRRYNVLVQKPVRGEQSKGSCDCASGVYRPGEFCRHVSFMAALWLQGNL